MAEYNWLPGLPEPDARAWRRDFSRVGLALTVLLLLPQGVSLLLLRLLLPADGTVGVWLVTVLSQYAVGFPAAALVLGRPTQPRGAGEGPLRPLRLLLVLVMALGGLYAANLLTVLALGVVAELKGSPVVNPVESLNSLFPLPLTMLTVCVLAPVWEELFFRRLLLDHLRPYGARFAVTASALAFAMLHGNFAQMLYAFVLGLLFAWLALRSCRVWQAVLLHALVNLVGGNFLFAPFGDAGLMAMGLLVLGLIPAAVCLFLYYHRAFRLDKGTPGVDEGKKWALWFLNPGMLVFCLATLIFAALYLAL